MDQEGFDGLYRSLHARLVKKSYNLFQSSILGPEKQNSFRESFQLSNPQLSGMKAKKFLHLSRGFFVQFNPFFLLEIVFYGRVPLRKVQ
jgi:hypothetical protein